MADTTTDAPGDRTPLNLSPQRRFLFRLILAGFALLIIAVPAELVLRVWEHALSGPRLRIMEENPHGTGSIRLKPDFHWTAHVGYQKIRIRTNHQGMHWYPVDPHPSPERRRIAFLGDSFTFGLWAPRFEESFVGLENALLVPRGWEALNFGVPGYGFDDMELILKEEVAAFEPKIVILMYYTGNDFRDTYLGLRKSVVVDGTAHWNREVLQAKLPPEMIPPERTAQGDSSKAAAGGGLKGFLRSHFALIRSGALLKSALQERWKRPPDQGPGSTGASGPRATAADSLAWRTDIFTSSIYWSQTHYPPLAAAARDTSLATLVRINRYCRERGMRLCIAAIPYREQVCGQVPVSADFDDGLPQRCVEEFARSRGIPYLDLLPGLREQARPKPAEIYVRGDTHFNGRGHALVARILDQWIENEVLGSARP